MAYVGKITQKASQIPHFGSIKSKIERRKNQSKTLCKSHIADDSKKFSHNLEQHCLPIVEDKLKQSTETFRRSFSQVNIGLNNDANDDKNIYIKVRNLYLIINPYLASSSKSSTNKQYEQF